MERAYEEAFTEVEEVLKLMPIDLVSKIPAQFRQTISANKATNYKVIIKAPLEEQELKKETTVILGLIYRDFLASPEEREQLQIKDEEELRKIEQKMQDQYSNDLAIYREPNFLIKFFNIFKEIFKKNKF